MRIAKVGAGYERGFARLMQQGGEPILPLL